MYGLIECAPHGNVIREIRRESAIEICRAGLKMGREPPIPHGQIIVFFFVHLLVDDILLRHPKRPARPPLMDLGCASSRFDSCFQAPIASPRRSNISSGCHQSRPLKSNAKS